MFSASQQAQAGSPWAQKSSAAPFGTPGSMNFGNTSFGAAPATPAHGQQGFLNAGPSGTPNPLGLTPQSAQGKAQQNAPWGQQTNAFGTPQHQAHAQAHHAGFSPAPNTQPPMGGAQQPLMQPGQAPVDYLPGYLSKMRSSTQPSASASRPIESTSSPPARDADTSLSLTKEAQGGARTLPSASPVNRFSSSFFNAPLGGDDSRIGQTPPPAGSGVREGSIFGYGGLRGTRKQEEADRSVSLRAPTSPPQPQPTASFFGTDYGASAMDDDDAPPQDALSDMAQAPAFAASLAASAAPAAPRVEKETTEVALAQRVVLVYGFPGYLYTRIVEQFAAIGGLHHAEEVPLDHGKTALETTDGKPPPPGATPTVARLTYNAPYQALLAVRRGGELFANTCIVGVRWEDDALHQLSLVKGLDAPLLPSTERAAPAPATPAPARAGAKGGAEAKGTPLFGRPISVVDTPVSALARKDAAPQGMSPLRAVVHAGESLWHTGVTGSSQTHAQPGAPPPAPGLLGRLADGLFGW